MSPHPELDRLEWQAVSVALNDAAGCGCGAAIERGRLRRSMRRLFQIPTVRPLADPRLEALRRFVCQVRRRGDPAGVNGDALAAFGYNDRQIKALALLSA